MDITLEAIGIPSDALLWKVALLSLVAFVVGFIGGLVGLALGTLRLPPILILGYSAPIAAGTNVALSALSAFSGSLAHLRGRRVDFRVVLAMGLPSIAGGFLGGFYGGRVPEAVLLILIAVLVGWNGISMLLTELRRRDPAAVGKAALAGRSPTAFYSASGGIGLGIGLLGGAVGLILGTLRLPAMIRLGMNPRIAAGTNFTIGFMLGVFGFFGHLLHGEVDWPLLISMGALAMFGSYLGARQTGRIGLRPLRLLLGSILCVCGLALIHQVVLRWGL